MMIFICIISAIVLVIAGMILSLILFKDMPFKEKYDVGSEDFFNRYGEVLIDFADWIVRERYSVKSKYRKDYAKWQKGDNQYIFLSSKNLVEEFSETKL